MHDYPSSSDKELAVAWIDGDNKAARELIARFMPQVHRFFHNKLAADDADELVQNTFMDLQRALATFRHDASVRTLIFTIARRKLNGHLRVAMRERDRNYDPSEQSLEALGTTPSEHVARKAEERVLLTALRKLPLDTQIMIELHYWEDMGVSQVAEILDVPKGTVQSAIARGRKKLAKIIDEIADSDQELAGTQSHITAWAMRMREELDER